MSAVDIRNSEPVPELGPAMRALPPRWQRAALALFTTNGNRSDALRVAGYGKEGGHPGSINTMASRMFLDPRMRAAVTELCRQMIETVEPELFAVVLGIMRDNNTDAKDKLRAAAMIWDRANPVMTKHKVEVEHHLTTDELDLTHYRALKKLGAPQSAFLARFGANGLPRVEAMVAADDAKMKQIADQSGAIEGEFEEVSDDRER